MGAWGTGWNENDNTLDIRDDFVYNTFAKAVEAGNTMGEQPDAWTVDEFRAWLMIATKVAEALDFPFVWNDEQRAAVQGHINRALDALPSIGEEWVDPDEWRTAVREDFVNLLEFVTRDL